MPLGIRGKEYEGRPQTSRRTNTLMQMTRNGLLLATNNSDQLYKELLAQQLGLAQDTPWGDVVRRAERRSARELLAALTVATTAWCEQAEGIVAIWTGMLSTRQGAIAGYRETIPDLIVRIQCARRLLREWGFTTQEELRDG